MSTVKERNGATSTKKSSPVRLKLIQRARYRLGIRSTSPLIMHAWDEKALRMIREKQQEGKKTKNRENKDPKKDMEAAIYRTESGEIGIPGMGLKSAILTAAHKDIGIERTMCRKALFLVTDDPNKIIPIQCGKPVLREDCVRVGSGSTDLRYRPQFNEWSALVTFEIDEELLQMPDVVTLVNRAGFGVGIGDWRPEKGGEYGRFELDTDVPIEEVK